MQSLPEQKKELEEQIALKAKAIEEAEQSLSVEKALLKQDRKKLEILAEAIAATTAGSALKEIGDKVDNALNDPLQR